MDKKPGNKRGGSSPEFVELLTTNYYKIHCFILSLVPDKTDAEDVLQSSITYMWEHFEDFQIGSNFLSWAFTISKFQVLTHLKKKQRSKVIFSEKAISLIESENQKLCDKMEQRYDALKVCVEKLSVKDRSFLRRRFEDNMKIKTLASEVGISVNVAYKRIARIKNLLLNCIRKTLSAGGVL